MRTALAAALLALAGCQGAQEVFHAREVLDVVQPCPPDSARTPGRDARNCYCDCGFQADPDAGTCYWTGGNADAPAGADCRHGEG